jgi:hypothetical protein
MTFFSMQVLYHHHPCYDYGSLQWLEIQKTVFLYLQQPSCSGMTHKLQQTHDGGNLLPAAILAGVFCSIHLWVQEALSTDFGVLCRQMLGQ